MSSLTPTYLCKILIYCTPIGSVRHISVIEVIVVLPRVDWVDRGIQTAQLITKGSAVGGMLSR